MSMEIVNTGSKPAHGLQASRRGRGLAFQAAQAFVLAVRQPESLVGALWLVFA